MYAGPGLTVVTLAVPYADHATANVLAELGWARTLPCLAGLLAVTLLGRSR